MDKKLISLIKSVEYVSFDIFDTAILRNCLKPTDVFNFVQQNYEQNNAKLEFNFTKARISAEIEARNKTNSEINLDEIYDALKNNTNISNDTLGKLKELEIETEKDLCCQNPYIYNIYKYCLKKNKKVIFVTDMYLDKSVIKEILFNASYKDFKRLFVSSEISLTKHKGELYDFVLENLNTLPKNILHIGDNFHSDVKQAQEKQLKAFYYPKCSERALNHPLFYKESSLFSDDYSSELALILGLGINKVCNNVCKNNALNKNFWFQLGYKTLGPVALSFVQHIKDFAIKEKYEKIFFLSRDGYILNKVYDLIKNNQDAHNSYLYTSRRISYLSALNSETKFNSYDANNCLDYLQTVNFTTLDELLKLFNVNDKLSLKTIKSKLQLSNTKITPSNLNLNQLFDTILEDIKQASQKERENVIEYYKSQGLFDFEKILSIDIGWRGSVQKAFNSLIKQVSNNINLHGIYMGLFEPANKAKQTCSMHGYFFDSNETNKASKIFKQATPLIEFFFSAPHGSLVRIIKQNDELIPIFDNDNLKKQSRIIESIHSGIIEFTKDFLKIQNKYLWLKLNKNDALFSILRLIDNPSYEEAKNLSSIAYTNGSKLKLINTPNFIQRLLKPKNLNIEVQNSLWSAGYLALTKAQNSFNAEYLQELNDPKCRLKNKFVKLKINNFVKQSKNKKIIFYGAGTFAQTFIEEYDLSSLNIVGFIDKDHNKTGEMLGEHKIFHINDFSKLEFDVIIPTMLNSENIKHYLSNIIDENDLKTEIITNLFNID